LSSRDPIGLSKAIGFSLRDERDYAAALDELGDLVLSDPGTPASRRFDELIMLIEEYEALRGGYLLLPRAHRKAQRNRARMLSAAGPRAANP
jgi:hypothetical protein